MQFIGWSHKIEGPSGAALWLKEPGNQSKSPLNTHALHPPESGHFPTCLESKSLGECHSFPLSSQQVLNTITCEGKPHDPLDLPSFVPANETAANGKVTEQRCLVPAHQKAGGGSVYSPSLLTLQKCSPDEFLLHGNDWQVSLLWGFTSRGKRSNAVHRGVKTKVRRV